MLLRWSLLAAVLVIAACSPGYDTASCTIVCGSNAACPSELTCQASGYCGVAADQCPLAIDAGIDATIGPTPTFVEMSAGLQHTCGIDTAGALYCWGDNERGQLTHYNASDFGMPVAHPQLVDVPQVVAPVTWKHVTAGATHTCAITSVNTMFCWGDNTFSESGAAQMPQNGLDIVTPNQITAVDVPNGNAAVSWVQVAAGDSFTCALGNDGTATDHPNVYCWGNNADGEMGNGTTSFSQQTLQPALNLTNADQIDAGARHVCAHTTSNNVFCWGANSTTVPGTFAGQSNPSDSTMLTIATPLEVSELGNVASVSAGVESTCALLMDGSIQCWGLDVDGSLGGGGTGNVQTVPAAGGKWLAVADGDDTGCGIYQPPSGSDAGVSSPLIECWGHNQGGDRGVVTPENGAPNTTPLPNTPTPITAVANSNFAAKNLTLGDRFGCAYDGASGEFCWGQNHRGQTGLPIVQRTASLLGIDGSNAVAVALAAGSDHTCVIQGPGLSSELALCWGLNDVNQVINYGAADSLETYRVNQPIIQERRDGHDLPFAQPNFVSAGAKHTCVESTESDGDLTACWGDNGAGQLPNDDPLAIYGEMLLPSANTIDQLSSGGDFTCVNATNVNAVAVPQCWGTLGSMPPMVPGTATALQVDGGDDANQSLGVSESSVWASIHQVTNGVGAFQPGYWGDPLLVATDEPPNASFADFVPINGVPSGNDVEVIAQGTAAHRCFADSSGLLTCGGANDFGQIPGAATTSVTPIDLAATMSLSTAFVGWPDDGSSPQLAVGARHTCAVTGDGRLYCWGDDRAWQLGTPANSPSDGQVELPKNAPTDATWVAVVAGDRHTCGVVKSGTGSSAIHQIYCWGAGESGQLGVIDGNGTEPSFQRLPTKL